jgi:hypothetical protein
VRPDRRQRYPRVAVHLFEVERLVLWRKIRRPRIAFMEISL